MNWTKLLQEGAKIVATSPETTTLTVETMDNHVYFYSEVNADRCLALVKQLRMLDAQLRNERITRNVPDSVEATPIWLHIYSGGGELFAGLSLADQLQGIQTPIYSIVEGMAASAATLISMSCTRRYILPSSFMMIHQLSSVAWGTHEKFKDEMRLQEMAMERMVAFYSARSKTSAETVREMLRRDTWMSATDCFEGGFVDEIANL